MDLATIGGLVEGVVAIVSIVLDVSDSGARTLSRSGHLFRLYGVSGLFLFVFGDRTTWRTQAEVLGKLEDEDAMAFKKLVQDECTMVSVAAAIVAQIAITGLSLNNLSQTHWVARAFFLFSLTSALMAVYYATTQQRVMGKLLKAKQVRLWIRGGSRAFEKERIIPSLEQLTGNGITGLLPQDIAERGEQVLAMINKIKFHRNRILFQYVFKNSPSDPDEYDPEPMDRHYIREAIIRQCFLPGTASVITISAPQMLLSASLIALLIGFGIYIGFTWTRNLDSEAGSNDSRNVFITYAVTLGVCFLVYTVSGLVHEEDKRTERGIVEDYLREYVKQHPEVVRRWGYNVEQEGIELQLIPVHRDNQPEDVNGNAAYGNVVNEAPPPHT